MILLPPKLNRARRRMGNLMPLVLRHEKTATGRISVVVGPECQSDKFPSRAQEVVELFQLVVEKKIAGFDELIWIARKGDDTFCISWDIWFPEVSIMAWESTPDSRLEELTHGN